MQTNYPYFKLYASTFIVETIDMTSEERGAYMLLLCHAWLANSRGVLTTKDDELARLAQMSLENWKKIKVRVLSKFKTSNAKIMSIMLIDHWKDCQEKSTKSTKAINSRWRKEKKNESKSGSPRPEVAGSENVIVTD